MRHITISGQHRTGYTVTAAVWTLAALWIVVGSVAAIGPGGGLTRLALALAIVTTEWWLLAKVDRFERNDARSDAETAPVTYLRPASTGQRDLKTTSIPASWRGPSAA
jgi:hypothetical protein